MTRFAAENDLRSRSPKGQSSPYLSLHARDQSIPIYLDLSAAIFTRTRTFPRKCRIYQSRRSFSHGTILVAGFYELIKRTRLQVRQSVTGGSMCDSISSRNSCRRTRNTWQTNSLLRAMHSTSHADLFLPLDLSKRYITKSAHINIFPILQTFLFLARCSALQNTKSIE